MLDVNGHIAGLDEEVADARCRVFHHQLPGGVVILRAAVADPGQQVVHLIAQAALGQGHVQHHSVGVLLLHRRQRGAQAVQFVEVDRKADGPGPGGEFLHQQIVASALQQRAGQAAQIPLKNKAVVVFHLARQRQVQPGRAARLCQRRGQCPQLGGGFPHPGVPAQGLGLGQDGGVIAAQLQQGRQGVRPGALQPGSGCSGPQLVDVFGPQRRQQAGPGGFRHAQRIKQPKQVAQVAHFQHPGPAQLLQRLRRQTDGLLHCFFVHGPQQFQAHLGDFLEGVALRRGAVDVFVVVVFQRLAGGGLGRLGNGEGHIRLQRQQPPVQIGEGDDLLRREEAAVLLIQPVLLKPPHVVFAAPRRLVQRPQRKGRPLLGQQP